ncbi:MAG: biotin/lipoyl-containing protein [Thermoanaerobaculia bacterium]
MDCLIVPTRQVKVPDLGDVDKVDVVEVLVANGEQVEVDSPLITLESDKASMDVPSPLAGKVAEVQVKAGDQVGEGDLILTLEVDAAAAAEPATETEAETPPSEPAVAEPPPEPEPPALEEPVPEAAVAAVVDEAARVSTHASPSVRRFARELGVDLTQVRGTGRKGRILKSDVQAWVKKTLTEPTARGGVLPEMPVIDYSRFGEIERVALTRVQKISGPSLQRSWLHVPHVTQHDQADITDLEAFRQTHKERAKAQGFSLTPVAFVMKAVVAALTPAALAAPE